MKERIGYGSSIEPHEADRMGRRNKIIRPNGFVNGVQELMLSQIFMSSQRCNEDIYRGGCDATFRSILLLLFNGTSMSQSNENAHST
jgi:hypothetical protein